MKRIGKQNSQVLQVELHHRPVLSLPRPPQNRHRRRRNPPPPNPSDELLPNLLRIIDEVNMSSIRDLSDSFHGLVEEGLRWSLLLVEMQSEAVDLERRFRSVQSHAEIESGRVPIPKDPRGRRDDQRVEKLFLFVLEARLGLAGDESTDESFRRLLFGLEVRIVEPFQKREERTVRMLLGSVLVESSKSFQSVASSIWLDCDLEEKFLDTSLIEPGCGRGWVVEDAEMRDPPTTREGERNEEGIRVGMETTEWGMDVLPNDDFLHVVPTFL